MSVLTKKPDYLNKDQLITQLLPKVKRLAYHLAGRLPTSVNVDDLIQSGIIGLIEAAENYRPELGVKLETFADKRILGAMFDELRKVEFVSRSVRSSMRSIETVVKELEQQLHRPPYDTEIAAKMRISLEEYHALLRDGQGHRLLYYEDFQTEEGAGFLEQQADSQQPTPLERLEDNNFHHLLVEGIKHLPEREKLLMSLYYEQNLNFKEIGAVLGVSESRVCQLHTQAISRLRVRVKDWLEE